ncbi:MAG: hypothetical protein NZ529_02115 [Cytophagaceae bacterium]|nr:hypothetical protein [Cytophagaceae bacterium]MDW8455563.1 hypothetical protein [Cytophagaceae bacterium]
MEQTLTKVKLNKNLYLRNPYQPEYGGEIVPKRLRICAKFGVESFIYETPTLYVYLTEAFIYRYFTNKYNLTLTTSLDWRYFTSGIQLKTHYFSSRTLNRLGAPGMTFFMTKHIIDSHTSEMAIPEPGKSYVTTKAEQAIKENVFTENKNLCTLIAHVVLEKNHSYIYPKTSENPYTQATHLQMYFNLLVPDVSDIKHRGKRIRIRYYFSIHFTTTPKMSDSVALIN